MGHEREAVVHAPYGIKTQGFAFKRANAESVRQFQPRVALWQPWENASHFSKAQLFEELRRRLFTAKPRNPFRVANKLSGILSPGFQSKPWADISQRFQRYSIFARTHEFATFCERPDSALI